jgi:hypothetical protein
MIASVLAQKGVKPVYSGASIVDAAGDLVIEGVAGSGDQFMLGNALPFALPDQIAKDVRDLNARLRSRFGPIRTEWVHDGEKLWLVQLHKGATTSVGHVLVPGERQRWLDFNVELGLESLRKLLQKVDEEEGINLVGQVGMTSHIADLVRKAGIPTRIVSAS